MKRFFWSLTNEKRKKKSKLHKNLGSDGLTAQASSLIPPTLLVRLLAADLKMNSTVKTDSILQSVVL